MRVFQSRAPGRAAAPFAREARFSNRVLLRYAAAGLPRTFAIRAAAGDGLAEILLYDEIGYWGVTDMDFVRALALAGDGPLHLRINSPGGDVFHGMAIYNAVKSHPWPISVSIDGVAASAASWVAIAGKSLAMPEMSMLMIHNSKGMAFGDKKAMTDTADILAKIDGLQAAAYAAKSRKPVAEMASLMDAETWLTGMEAQSMGLCDMVVLPDDLAGPNASATAVGPYCARTTLLRAAYDPDGDGDDDALEAAQYIQMAIGNLADALGALIGTEDGDNSDEAGGGEPPPSLIVPGARRPRTRTKTAAATAAEWVVSAAEDLPIDEKDSWDGPAAAERMLEEAGFNGNSPDPAKAKRGFLVWDHHNPNLKGSYKLPFADLVNGELKAVKGGVDAAASRLPQTDIPDDVRTRARAVIDHYENRMKPPAPSGRKDGPGAGSGSNATQDLRMRRLRLAEAA